MSTNQPVALVSGITGQDGSYLTESLIEKGWQVHGLVRRTSAMQRSRIDLIQSRFPISIYSPIILHYVDALDPLSIFRIVESVKPEYIFNLAAQSHVGISFELPRETINLSMNLLVSFMDSVRSLGLSTKIYQAGSSEMFGGMLGRERLDETSEFFPKSPYAAGKVLAHNLAVIYREAYNLNIVNGILFNHESPRRGENFVSRKITLGASRIKYGLQRKLSLGNVHAKRDWGHASDYIKAIELMTVSPKLEDYVIATGKMHSVEEFLRIVFDKLDLEVEKYVEFDPKLKRPNEVDDLLGSPEKAARELGWSPTYSLENLIDEMLESDLSLVRRSL